MLGEELPTMVKARRNKVLYKCSSQGLLELSGRVVHCKAFF